MLNFLALFDLTFLQFCPQPTSLSLLSFVVHKHVKQHFEILKFWHVFQPMKNMHESGEHYQF